MKSISFAMTGAALVGLVVSTPLPATTPAAQLEARELARVTRTFTRDGTVYLQPIVQFAEMATACGYGSNTAGACEPLSRVYDIKVTRTLDNGLLFISDQLSTSYKAQATRPAAFPGPPPQAFAPNHAPIAKPTPVIVGGTPQGFRPVAVPIPQVQPAGVFIRPSSVPGPPGSFGGAAGFAGAFGGVGNGPKVVPGRPF